MLKPQTYMPSFIEVPLKIVLRNVAPYDDRELYFHKNSRLDEFEKLKIGTEVRFNEEEGEKWPQASTVKIVRKAHLHHRRR